MIDWSDNFSVNFKAIDKQHKILISIINEITELLKTDNCNFETMYEVVRKMEDYMDEHFQFEEKMMMVYNYPEMEAHVSQHNQYRYHISEFDIFEVESPREKIEDALVYLVEWLAKHIMNTDKKLGAFMNQVMK